MSLIKKSQYGNDGLDYDKSEGRQSKSGDAIG